MQPPLNERKQAFINILERTAGEVYTNCKSQALALLEVSEIPATAQIFVRNYIQTGQPKLFCYLEGKIAEMADLCFMNEETTLEEALKNSDGYINTLIGDYLSKKLNMPTDAINVCASVLFGKNLT